MQVGDSGIGEFSVPVSTIWYWACDGRVVPPRALISLAEIFCYSFTQLSAFLQGLRSIVGCVEGNCDPHELIPQLVEEYQAGKVGSSFCSVTARSYCHDD